MPTISDVDVRRYLDRIEFELPISIDLETLTALQRAHLTAVAFENLDVHAGNRVETGLEWSIPKLLDRDRGGWCFELNGAFSALLRSLGFDVLVLGAAVLLNGPTRVVDHATIEVRLDESWLVDVGFGNSFFLPLALNRPGPQDGGSGEFEFLGSPEGTTMAKLEQGVPVAQYRFKRVAHELTDFVPASDALQDDDSNHWRNKPFATRLLAGGPDRVTLLGDRLKLEQGGSIVETPVESDAWPAVLWEWFRMLPPSMNGPANNS